MLNEIQKEFLIELLENFKEGSKSNYKALIELYDNDSLEYNRNGRYTYCKDDAKVNDFIYKCGLWAETGMYAEGIVFRHDAESIYDESSNYLENEHMTDELKQFFKDSDDPYEDGSDFMYVTGCSDYTYVTNIKKKSDYPNFTSDDIKNHFGLSDVQFELLVIKAHAGSRAEILKIVNNLDIIKKYSSKLEFLNEYIDGYVDSINDEEYSDISQLLCDYAVLYFDDEFYDTEEFESAVMDVLDHINNVSKNKDDDKLNEARNIVKLFVKELSELV